MAKKGNSLKRRVTVWAIGSGAAAVGLALWLAPDGPWWIYPFLFVVAAAVAGRLASGIVREPGWMDEA